MDDGSFSKEWYLIALAFTAGMAIMGVEISAGRLLAPFFGTSILIWTVIIASTMLALAIGYYMGGVLAERRPELSVLGTVLFVAAVYTVFLPYVVRPVMEFTITRLSQSQDTVVIGLLVCGVLISVPLVMMAVTSPFIIRLDSVRSSDVGRLSGKVFAFSTGGSILGTLLPALLLIPLVGTRFTFLFFGAVLLLMSVPALNRSRLVALGVGVVLILVALSLGLRARAATGIRPVAEIETNYQHVKVFQTAIDRGTNAVASILLTDSGLAVQSAWVRGWKSTDSPQDFWPMVPRIYETSTGQSPLRMLMVGLGGAIAPYLITQLFPDITIDGVEIDGGLVEVARPFFPFSMVKGLHVHIGDGRFFIRTARVAYDIIAIDAFRSSQVPFHLATAEFFSEARGLLGGRGLLAMNVPARGEARLFNGIANTLASVFPYVYFATYPAASDKIRFHSRFLVASEKELSLENRGIEDRITLVADAHWRRVFSLMRDPTRFSEPDQKTFFTRVAFDEGRQVLSDDRSSLELTSEREFLGLILGTHRWHQFTYQP